MADISISRLPREEAARIMPVMTSAFDPAFGEAWRLDQCIGSLLLPGSALYVAQVDGKDAGFALVQTLFENSELLLLAVDPLYRGNGIGTKLVKLWQEIHVSEGGQQLFLEVRENNPALKFYQDLGFDIVGRRAGYYKTPDGNNLAALTMNKIITDFNG